MEEQQNRFDQFYLAWVKHTLTAMEYCHIHCRFSSQKSLALIQIEEEAILELENLYSARDNPDEFITVKRCRPTSKLAHSKRPAAYKSQLSQDSPWGKDHV